MPEFVDQVCVKLIGCGGAPNHNCALKPPSAYFSKYTFEVKN